MAVSKRKRFEVFKRDKFTCQYCGKRPPDVVLECDHIVPKVEGGPDTLENLTTSCMPCNQGKAGKPLDDVAPALDELEQLAALQEMQERKRDLRQQIAAAEAQRETEEEAINFVADLWVTETGSEEGFVSASVAKFLKRNLSLDRIQEAVESTRNLSSSKSGYQKWRYFCGACWKMVRACESSAQ